MTETVSRILIKSSTVKPTPNTGDLQRAELAYSYTSDKLFIGDEAGQDFYVIGGNAFLNLFKDVLSDDGVVHAGKVFPNNVIVAGANNNIDTLDIETLKINGKELVTGGIEELITDNTLPNVSHTKLITAQATKEYVDFRTERFLANFDEENLTEAQVLIVNDDQSFSNKTITGVLELTANGNTSLKEGSVDNTMIANNFIQVGTQKIELGKAALVNLNLDTSAVLDVHRGGTGRYDLEKYNVLLSNNTNNIHTTNGFYYDWDQEELFVRGNTQITENANVEVSLTVADSFFTSTNRLQFRDFFQVLTVGGGNSFDSSIISYDTVSEYFSFSSGTVLNVSDAGLVNILSPTLFFGSEVTISDDTVTNIHGLLKIYNNTEFTGNTITISENTVTTVNGISHFNDNVFVNGNTLNVSENTITTIDGISHFNDNVFVNGNTLNVSLDTISTFYGPFHSLTTATLNDVFVKGNTLNVSVQTFSEFYGNTFIYGETLNTSSNTLSTFDGPVIINGKLDVNGDVTFRGNTTFLGEDFIVSDNTTLDISGNTFFKSEILNVSANTITTVDGESTFNKKVDVNAPLTVYDNAEIKGNLVVEQDLFVYGNSTQILTETLTVEDNIILLGANNITDVVDLGFAGRYNESGSTVYAGLFRDATDNKFYLFEDYPTEPPITSMVGFNSSTMLATLYADIEANTIIAYTGTLDDVIITNSEFNDSTANNITIDNSTLNNVEIYDSTANNLVANNSTLNNVEIYDSYANNLVANNSTLNNAELNDSTANNLVANNSTLNSAELNDSTANNLVANNSTLNHGTLDNFVITNSELIDSTANNLVANNTTLNHGTLDNFVITNSELIDSTANNLVANNVDINFGTIRSVSIYNSTIYESSIVDDSTANNLTSNNAILNFATIETALANNIISNNATLNSATIYNAVANNLLSNNATLYFAEIYNSNLYNAYANTLTVDVLDAGQISFRTAIENIDANNYFGNTATINDIVANNITTNTFSSLVRTEATEEIKVLGVSSTSGKLVLNCEFNTHGQTIIAQPHSAGVTNILTLPAGGNQEIVGTTATQTLTNKTLTSAIINTSQIYDGIANNLVSNNATINDSTLNNVLITSGIANNTTLNNPTLNNAEFTEEILVLGVSGTSGKLILNCEVNTHGQTIIAQPHSAGVTNILTLPAGSDQEIVGTTATQTLTNKTLDNVSIVNSIISNSTATNLTINSSENSTANNLISSNTTLSGSTTINGPTTINANTTISENLTVEKDLFVDGDLYLTGNTVSLDAQTLTIEDNIIIVGSNNVADVVDLGFAGKYNDGSNDLYTGLFRDATDGVFYLFNNYNQDPSLTMSGYNINTMIATLYGNFEANNITVESGSLENVTSNNTLITNSTINDSIIDCGTF